MDTAGGPAYLPTRPGSNVPLTIPPLDPRRQDDEDSRLDSLGHYTPPGYGYQGWEYDEDREDMTWHKFASSVSQSTLAQLFQYWRDGTFPAPEAKSELLGAGLEWYWGFGQGPPSDYTEKYLNDLREMYERAMGSVRSGSVRVPGLSNELARTPGPWYGRQGR